MHVREPTAVLVPYVAQFAQLVGGVKPARRHVDTEGVELGHGRVIVA